VLGSYVSGGKGPLQIADSAASGLSSTLGLSFADSNASTQALIYKEPTTGDFKLVNQQAANLVFMTNSSSEKMRQWLGSFCR
jgi:hypothetical protein